MKAWLVLLVMGSTISVNLNADEVDYLRDIKPLLSEKCSACHGALKQEAGLRLDAGSLILDGSSSGPVLTIGNASESLIIERVSDSDPDFRMPPEGLGEPLSAKQIEVLKNWIDQGSVVPDLETIPSDPKDHWAYQLPRKEMPTPNEVNELPNPIDVFIRNEQHQLGLTPVEKALPHTLLRRAHFDLIGLPPTRKELKTFLQNESDAAWETTIDRLLSSPQYGERWGRHWMDVWRYSDWDGYKEELRGSQRHIWHWRDWIVHSLNADKPYDQMIIEMLAADELAPSNPKTLAATGFLARNFHNTNRNIWLDATVEHTAKAFLGMTLNCARCHDHKFDPIPQKAYYEFRAIFEPHNVRTDQIPGQSDIKLDGLPRAFDADLEAETFVFAAGDEKQPLKDEDVSPFPPRFLNGNFEIQPVTLPVFSSRPDLRDFVVAEHQAQLKNRLIESEQKLKAAATAPGKSVLTLQYAVSTLEFAVAQLGIESFETRLAADREKTDNPDNESAITQLATKAADSERKLKTKQAELEFARKQLALKKVETAEQDDSKKKQNAIAKAVKEVSAAKSKFHLACDDLKKTDTKYSPLGKQYPQTSSGRRLALARWIASKDNPLTARVAINQIWMRHFGSPLVANPFDFGLRSPRPQHAKLLDWLAVELMENDWSLKHIHRLILTSQTWQLASSSDSKVADQDRQLDPDNKLYWRMNAQRLDAEIIRDNLLSVSGQLENKIGGPDIDFKKGESSHRRSIYLRHAYEKQMRMLVLFDTANPNDCYRRSQSIIPQQALALVNSSLSQAQSRLIARQLWEETSGHGETEFLLAAFQQLLGRLPDPSESKECLLFLEEHAKLLSDKEKLIEFTDGKFAKVKPSEDPAARARENLVHVLLNHNDFITVR